MVSAMTKGSTIVKQLPFPTSLSTPMVPPCNSTIFRVNATQAQSYAFIKACKACRARFKLFELPEKPSNVLCFDANTRVSLTTNLTRSVSCASARISTLPPTNG